jgi:hypothetical protein
MTALPYFHTAARSGHASGLASIKSGARCTAESRTDYCPRWVNSRDYRSAILAAGPPQSTDIDRQGGHSATLGGPKSMPILATACATVGGWGQAFIRPIVERSCYSHAQKHLKSESLQKPAWAIPSRPIWSVSIFHACRAALPTLFASTTQRSSYRHSETLKHRAFVPPEPRSCPNAPRRHSPRRSLMTAKFPASPAHFSMPSCTPHPTRTAGS